MSQEHAEVECEGCGFPVVLEQITESAYWIRYRYSCPACGYLNEEYPVEHLSLDLSRLTTIQLQALAEEAHQYLVQRRSQQTLPFSFSFHAKGNEKIGHVYVARLSWDALEQHIDRTFFRLGKKKNAGVTSVEETFTGRAGDVIEKQWSGSWQHPKPRAWYVVSEEGELVRVADSDDTTKYQSLMSYLKGERDLASLLLSLN